MSSLDLAISDEVIDWLIELEASLRTSFRATEHERLLQLVATIDSHPHLDWSQDNRVDDVLVAELGETIAWGDAFEDALATRNGLLVVDDFVDLDRVPPKYRAIELSASRAYFPRW